MEESQLRRAPPLDAGPDDLRPYMEQLQRNLKLVAQVIVQLDRRILDLEKRIGDRPSKQSHAAGAVARQPRGGAATLRIARPPRKPAYQDAEETSPSPPKQPL